ncbi:transcription regulator HTH, apses-type DNA-binding domain-containing protein [Fennellomyces sp. T-0311]|nr:transcription regulator HTH, apses-type DNA-binding domain-containing protein [Fennellomyces sp. T-0311]
MPRIWPQNEPYRDYHNNSNNSSSGDDTDHLPTSLPTPTGVAALSYPSHNNNSNNNSNSNNSNNNNSGSSSNNNYFAPPPSTPVPPPASTGSATTPAGSGGGAYTSQNGDSRQHLYHPYAANRRHSASSLGYGNSPGSNYPYGPAGLPSFAVHPSPRPPIIPRPKLTTTLWEDEGTICYQVDANGICVARRHDNDMINGTKLLNVAGMSRGKRDGILKNEKGRVVVKVGAMHLKGVWITFARAKTLATQYKILDILHPLFVDNPSNYLYASPLHHTHHNHGAAAAAAAASMTGLSPAAPATSTAGSRIDSGFSTASGTGGGAFRQPLTHHHPSSPPPLSSQQMSSPHAFQPPQGMHTDGLCVTTPDAE